MKTLIYLAALVTWLLLAFVLADDQRTVAILFFVGLAGIILFYTAHSAIEERSEK